MTTTTSRSRQLLVELLLATGFGFTVFLVTSVTGAQDPLHGSLLIAGVVVVLGEAMRQTDALRALREILTSRGDGGFSGLQRHLEALQSMMQPLADMMHVQREETWGVARAVEGRLDRALAELEEDVARLSQDLNSVGERYVTSLSSAQVALTDVVGVWSQAVHEHQSVIRRLSAEGMGTVDALRDLTAQLQSLVQRIGINERTLPKREAESRLILPAHGPFLLEMLLMWRIASVLRAQGRIDEAEDSLIRALDIGRQTEAPPALLAELLTNWGDVLASRGEQDRAFEVYRDALQQLRRAEGLGDR